jgi:hypothetical protein
MPTSQIEHDGDSVVPPAPVAPDRVIELDGIPWLEADLVRVLRTPDSSRAGAARLKRLREALSTKLHQQAWPILKAMVRDGRVDALSPWPAKYKSTDQVTLQNNEAVRDDLVANVIADALLRFWSHAIDGGDYQAEHGLGSASLLTYFINGACRQYARTYSEWAAIRHDKVVDQLAEMTDRPASHVSSEDRIVLERGFAAVDKVAKPVTRQLVALLRLGYTPLEASAALDLPGRSVEGYMRRLRASVAAARRRGEICSPWEINLEPWDPFSSGGETAPTRQQLRRRGSVVQ